MTIDFDKLQQAINYQFNDLKLARHALTHRSANKFNNERLEFLGDSLLGFLVAEFLFEHFPEASEGELSRLRASMVNKSALVEIALDLNLSEFLLLGDGELKSGGRERESILADSVEAIIAAIYFDGGLTACKQLIISWCQNKIDGISPVGTQKDAKTYLQEIMQAQGLRLPQYRVVDVTGKDHQQSFLVECRVENLDEPQQGEGNSIRSAEQEVARKILIELGETN